MGRGFVYRGDVSLVLPVTVATMHNMQFKVHLFVRFRHVELSHVEWFVDVTFRRVTLAERWAA